ncbi:hypothetical protein ElyMa_000040800, partial [Elysia marginata]
MQNQLCSAVARYSDSVACLPQSSYDTAVLMIKKLASSKTSVYGTLSCQRLWKNSL